MTLTGYWGARGVDPAVVSEPEGDGDTVLPCSVRHVRKSNGRELCCLEEADTGVEWLEELGEAVVKWPGLVGIHARELMINSQEERWTKRATASGARLPPTTRQVMGSDAEAEKPLSPTSGGARAVTDEGGFSASSPPLVGRGRRSWQRLRRNRGRRRPASKRSCTEANEGTDQGVGSGKRRIGGGA